MVVQESNRSLEISRPELKERRLSVMVYKPELRNSFKKEDAKTIVHLRPVYSTVNLTGFEAASIAQAESYALAVIEACVVARQLNEAFKISILQEPDTKRFAVQFAGTEDVFGIPEWTDKAIEEARVRIDRFLVANRLDPLKVDPNTNFPSFTVYENGVEVGGG